MKLIIAGSRYLSGEEAKQLVRDAISASGWTDQISEIVYGGARGIDSAAYDVAFGLWPTKLFRAGWGKHGRAAGPIRNREMAEYADALIAIPHPTKESRGTASMIEEMKKVGKPVFVYREVEKL